MRRTGVAVLAAGLLCSCAESTDGAATANPADAAGTTSSSAGPSASATTSTETAPTGVPGPSTFGVVETTRVPLEPDAETCAAPERPAGAQQVSFYQPAPGTPRVEIAAPEGWRTAVSQQDPTMTLTGPDGMSGSLTVAPTDLGPVEAFDKYNDDAMAKAPISSQSLLPAELCGYSGQKIIGTWSGSGGDPVQYADRIVHVWTNAASYLVAIHVEGPQQAPGLAAAQDLILSDFGVHIP